MTYNILNGGAGREQLILSVIQSIQPDIVILQEVYTPKFLQDLADALEMEPFFANGNQKRRVALLSHLPIRSVKSHHPILPIWRNVVASEIEYQSGQGKREAYCQTSTQRLIRSCAKSFDQRWKISSDIARDGRCQIHGTSANVQSSCTQNLQCLSR